MAIESGNRALKSPFTGPDSTWNSYTVDELADNIGTLLDAMASDAREQNRALQPTALRNAKVMYALVEFAAVGTMQIPTFVIALTNAVHALCVPRVRMLEKGCFHDNLLLQRTELFYFIFNWLLQYEQLNHVSVWRTFFENVRVGQAIEESQAQLAKNKGYFWHTPVLAAVIMSVKSQYVGQLWEAADLHFNGGLFSAESSSMPKTLRSGY